MSDISKEMRRDLKDFNQRHRSALQVTAQTLLAKGVVRVHYGVDYVNDDGSPADYAVLEYSDGRTEELDMWLEDLDDDTFALSVRYCHPYTFDARSAEVMFDSSGGMIDTEENVIRAYHTTERRAVLEEEADTINQLMDYSIEQFQTLSQLCALLEQHDFSDLYFGVDETPQGYALSDWAFALSADGGDEQMLEEQSEVFNRFLEALADFPEQVSLIGAFSLNVSTCWIYPDTDGGGLHDADDGTVRAYHTAAQLEALKAG